MAAKSTKDKWVKGIGIALVVYFVIGGLLEMTGYGSAVSESGSAVIRYQNPGEPSPAGSGWVWNGSRWVWRIIISG